MNRCLLPRGMLLLGLVFSLARGPGPYSQTIWQRETVAPDARMPLYTALALNAEGWPHISYCHSDGVVRGIKYLYYADESWHMEMLETEGCAGLSMALDRSGQPHFSFISRDSSEVRYAYYNGAAWYAETVYTRPLTAILSLYTSLALNQAGQPRMSYMSDHGLKYAWYDGLAWQVQSVEEAVGAEDYPSLSLDAAGRPHISYYNGRGGDLGYVWYDGAAWHSDIIDSFGNVGLNTSLALDAAGRPHISYLRQDPATALPDQLKYAWHDGTTWHLEVVDERVLGDTASLALDLLGHPHISYCLRLGQLACNALLYAWHDSSGWHIEQVDDTSEYTGMYSSLALDTVGMPRICYGSREGLKYTYRTAPMLPETGGPVVAIWVWIGIGVLLGAGFALRYCSRVRHQE